MQPSAHINVCCTRTESAYSGAPFTNMDFNPAWISDNISTDVWDKITNLSPNFNGTTVEVCK